MSTNQLDRGVVPGGLAVPPCPAVSDEVLAAAERLGVGRYLPAVIEFTLEIFGSFSDARCRTRPQGH